MAVPVEEEKEEDPDAHKTKMPPRLAHEKPSVAYHSPDSFTLSWKPAELPAYAKWTPIKYNIEMKDPYTQSWKVHKRDLEDSTFKFKNFPTDKDYCFRIRAINDFGKSEPSYSVLVTQEPGMFILAFMKKILFWSFIYDNCGPTDMGLHLIQLNSFAIKGFKNSNLNMFGYVVILGCCVSV